MKPWEKYQDQQAVVAEPETGPWTKYQGEEVEQPTDKPGLPFDIPLELYAAHEPTNTPAIPDWKRTASAYYRPLFEGGGVALGSLAGTGAGLATGPGAPVAVPVLELLGGTLGYGMGSGIADFADQRMGLRAQPSVKELIANTGENLRTGAILQGAGQILSTALVPVMRAGKWVFEKATAPVRSLFSKKAMEKAAGEVLVAHTSKGTIYAKNAEQAAEIEKQVPGLKFTLGQRTNDPALIKLERAQMRKPGGAATASAEQTVSNNEALRKYYQTNFPGEENVDDLVATLQKKQKLTGVDVDLAKGQAIGKAQALGPEKPQAVGRQILSEIDTAKKPVKAAMGELEAGIPDYDMAFTKTKESIKDILSNKKLSIGQRQAVEKAEKDILKVLERGQTTYTAFGVRRTLNDEIEKAYNSGNDSVGAILMKVKAGLEGDLKQVSDLARTGKMADFKGSVVYPDKLAKEFEQNATKAALLKSTQKPDVTKMTADLKDMTGSVYMQVKGESTEEFVKRLSADYTRRTGKEIPYEAIKGNETLVSRLLERNKEIKTILDQVEPGKDVAASMKAYNDFASSQYFARFDRGATKQATARGTQAAGTASRLENIPGYFTTASGADDLIGSVGKDNAARLMKGHYSYDLLENATKDGFIDGAKLKTWLQSNGEQLKKYGLYAAFDDVLKAQAVADSASTVAYEFERSAATRLLAADPEKAIAASIKGNSAAKTATELLDMVKGDKAAQAGLKNAFADHIMSEVQTTAKDIAGNPVVSNAAFQRIWGKYLPSMKVLYAKEPAKLKALETMKTVYEITVRNTKSPIGGGSDTAENILTTLSTLNLATSMSRSAAVIRGVAKAIKKYSSQQIDDLVTRAMIDPDYAGILIRATKPGVTELEVQTMIDGKIVLLDQYRKSRIAAAAAGAGGAYLGAEEQ